MEYNYNDILNEIVSERKKHKFIVTGYTIHEIQLPISLKKHIKTKSMKPFPFYNESIMNSIPLTFKEDILVPRYIVSGSVDTIYDDEKKNDAVKYNAFKKFADLICNQHKSDVVLCALDFDNYRDYAKVIPHTISEEDFLLVQSVKHYLKEGDKHETR